MHRVGQCASFLVLLVLTLLCPESTCHAAGGSAVLTVGDGEEIRQIRSKKLKRAADRSLTAEIQGTRIAVYHRSDESDWARKVLHLLRDAAQFVGEFYGKPANFDVEAFLVPVQPNEDHVNFQSQGNQLSLIVPYRPGSEDLFAWQANTLVLCNVVPHELTHVFQIRQGVLVQDGLIGEGLPEVIAERFRHLYCPDQLYLMQARTPGIVALRRVQFGPWKHYRMQPVGFWGRLQESLSFGKRNSPKTQGSPPPGYRAWQYAASLALLERWLDSATTPSGENPLGALVAAVNSREKITWEDTQELAQSMTGRSLEELGSVSEEQMAASRDYAWKERDQVDLVARMEALSTLRHLGLPQEAEADLLLEALTLPPPIVPHSRFGLNLLRAATGALATAEDPDLALAAIEQLREKGIQLQRAVAPELWGFLVMTGHSKAALKPLKGAVGDPWLTTEERWMARQILKRAREASEAGGASPSQPRRDATGHAPSAGLPLPSSRLTSTRREDPPR